MDTELCEAHGAGKKEKGSTWKKVEVVFNVESGLFLFLGILMCGIADVVFPDWFFFALYIYKEGKRKCSFHLC